MTKSYLFLWLGSSESFICDISSTTAPTVSARQTPVTKICYTPLSYILYYTIETALPPHTDDSNLLPQQAAARPRPRHYGFVCCVSKVITFLSDHADLCQDPNG
jgi:hypothetical protein